MRNSDMYNKAKFHYFTYSGYSVIFFSVKYPTPWSPPPSMEVELHPLCAIFGSDVVKSLNWNDVGIGFYE